MSDRALTRLLVAAACVAAFAPALLAGFAGWDDPAFVVDNPAIRGLDPARLRAMATSALGGVWIPLTWLSLALDRAVWGLEPAGYHLTNLFLHTLTVLLFHEACLVLFPRLGLRAPDRAAALAALFFAVHPLRVESVAWIAERKGVLSGALWTAALLARLRSYDSPRRARWEAASIATFALSVLAKPNGLTFPLVLAALEAVALRRRPAPAGYAPYLVLSAGAFAATMLAGSSAGAVGRSHPPSLAWTLGQASYGLVFYPLKTLWPSRLSIYYPPPAWFGSWSWPLAAHAAALAAVVLGLRAAGEKRRLVAAALACYALALMPMLGLVQHGQAHAAADRFSYLPSLALSAMLGGAFAAGGRAGLALAAACLLALGTASWRRCSVWATPLSLWSDAAASRPSAYALANAGALLARESRHAEAVERLRASLSLDDRESLPHQTLGVALPRLGREEEARSAWRAGLAAAPSPQLRSLLDASLARDAYERGRRASDAAKAEALYREAVRLDPAFGAARVNLGNSLARRGRLAEAAGQYRAVREEDRASFEARSNLEQVEALLKRAR